MASLAAALRRATRALSLASECIDAIREPSEPKARARSLEAALEAHRRAGAQLEKVARLIDGPHRERLEKIRRMEAQFVWEAQQEVAEGAQIH